MNVAADFVLVSSVCFDATKLRQTRQPISYLRNATGKSQAIFTAFQLSYLVTGTYDIVH